MLAVLTALTLPACAPLPATLRPITIIATATSAEPRPSLPSSLRADIVSMAKSSKRQGDATVRLITTPDGQITEHDLTPLRPNGDVQHATADADRQIAAKLDEAAVHLHNAVAGTPGLDLLPLLDRASQMPDSEVHLLSSGATTEDPTAFQRLGFGDDVAEAAKRVVDQSGLQLVGHRVTFHGLGVAAGSQPRFQPFERQAIETFWITVCQQAKADRCTVADDAPPTEPPIATLPVPGIPVAMVKTDGGCPVWQRLPDDALHFAGDSAVLPAGADAVLGQLVTQIRSCRLQVSVAGFIADTANGGDPRGLSGRRAQAVADRLVALGLPPAQLGSVDGRGTTDPVIVNFTNGVFDEAKAEQNRRVELSFVRLPTS